MALWFPVVLVVFGIPLCQGTGMYAQSTAPSVAPAARIEFDVASVKQNKSDDKPASTFPLNPGPQFVGNAGHLSATNMVVLQYIVFAYKMTGYQIQSIRQQLPDWARTDHFDIQAHVDGDPTKDQMRLMMQLLLEDRFKIKVHREIRRVPIFALVLAKPGRLGPELKLHPADDPDCTKTPLPQSVAGGYPAGCGAGAAIPASLPGLIAIGGRNVPLASFVLGLTNLGNNVDRPVLDLTGLTGGYDYTLEWQPESDDAFAIAPGADSIGATFTEALKDQLGLKLVAQKDLVDVIVLDHIDYPTAN